MVYGATAQRMYTPNFYKQTQPLTRIEFLAVTQGHPSQEICKFTQVRRGLLGDGEVLDFGDLISSISKEKLSVNASLIELGGVYFENDKYRGPDTVVECNPDEEKPYLHRQQEDWDNGLPLEKLAQTLIAHTSDSAIVAKVSPASGARSRLQFFALQTGHRKVDRETRKEYLRQINKTWKV